MATKITGTNTAAAPGVTGDDTDTGLFYGTNEIGFSTGGTSRLTLDSSGYLNVPDNGKIRLGTGSDLSLYHDGSHSYIKDAGTGQLRLQTSLLSVENAGGTENILSGTADGAVNLYYDGSKKAETVTGGFTVSGTCTATSFAGSGASLTGISSPLSFRNLIINGAMQIAQYGTSTTTNNTFCIDRWKCQFGGTDEAQTFTQHALTSSDTGPWAKGFRHSLHVQNGNQTSGAGATDYTQLRYIVEAQDIANSGWEYTSASSYITLSFWIKSSVAQDFAGNLKTSDGTEYTYAFKTGSLSADTWTKVTKTISGNANLTFNNDNGVGLILYFYPFEGTQWTGSVTENTWYPTSGNDDGDDNTTTWWTTNDATYELTGVQLEVGDTATEFEHRSYADELQRCMRYYEVIMPATSGNLYEFMGMWYAATEFTATIRWTVPKRATPTLVHNSGTNYFQAYGGSVSDQFDTWTGMQSASTRAGTIYNNNSISGGTTGHGGWCGSANNAAYIHIDAEL